MGSRKGRLRTWLKGWLAVLGAAAGVATALASSLAFFALWGLLAPGKLAANPAAILPQKTAVHWLDRPEGQALATAMLAAVLVAVLAAVFFSPTAGRNLERQRVTRR